MTIDFEVGSECIPNNMSEFKVCSQACDQCLFSDNRIVSEERANRIIEDCLKNDSWFECHKGTIKGEKFCCRGFWNRYKNDVWPLRLAQIYKHCIEFVNPEIEAENDY